jgi:hypothetical protein
MTMGIFNDDGDPPTGNPEVVDDSVEVAMDLEETTVSVVRKSVEKSGSRTSTSRIAHTSTSTSTSTSSKYKDKDKEKNNDKVQDKDNGQPTRVDVARVGMELEKSASVVGQSVEKLRNTSLTKEAARSASTSTSRLAHTSTSTTTRMGSNGHSTGVDNARVAGQSMEKSGNNSLQKKASRSATSTS